MIEPSKLGFHQQELEFGDPKLGCNVQFGD